MDHNGLYTDLDSFTSITNCGTTNTNFNDTCPTLLPSLNNFKYQQQTNLSSNIYQQPTSSLIDHHHQQQHQSQSNKSAANLSSSTGLPQTQININNCNNNIFFPSLDDGLFADSTTTSIGSGQAATHQQCSSSSNGNSINTNSNNNNSIPVQQQNKASNNNFIGYIRKDSNSNNASGGGGGGDNITYNINNINTNIVNNVVNNTDIFTGNQYHQISKPALGETIINFTNNNLNNTGGSSTISMPVDTASVTSQNFFGFHQTNSNSNNIIQGQSIFESTSSGAGAGQSQHHQTTQQQNSSSSSSFLDLNISNMGLFHGNHTGMPPATSYLQGNNNGNAQSEFPSSASTVSGVGGVEQPIYNDYRDTLSSADKIINNFETKNPLKYPSTSSNRTSGNYYGKTTATAVEYSPQFNGVNHLPLHSHAYSNVYPNANGLPPTKIVPPPTARNYPPDNYSRIPQARNAVPSYPHSHSHPYPVVEDPNSRAASLNRHHHGYHPMPNNGYGSYYGNGFNTLQHYPSPYPSQLPPPPPTYCSKPSQGNFNKSNSVVGVPQPVDHSNFTLPSHATSFSSSKKEFFQENPYYPPQLPPPPPHHMNSHFYEEPKKSSSHRTKVIGPPPGSEMFNNYEHQQHLMQSHPHPTARDVRYQQMPKPPPPNIQNYPPGMHAHPMQNSIDLGYHHSFQYPTHYKNNNSEHHKMPKMAPPPPQAYHYDAMPPAHHMQPYRYHHTMQAKPSEKIKISIDLEEQINSSKIQKMHHNPPYGYEHHHASPAHYYHPSHHHHPPHMIASRNHLISDETKSSVAANINISLRDFLQTWNEIDDEDDGTRMVEDVERTIRREYNPLFIQKPTADTFTTSEHQQQQQLRSSILNDKNCNNVGAAPSSEGNEKKLYVLESIDVPLSELNKYKHLSVINKLPENVVISDKEQLYADVDGSMKFIEEIDLTRSEKLYKSEFELEFEACEERKLVKPAIEESPPSSQTVLNEAIVKNNLKCEEEDFVDEMCLNRTEENVQNNNVVVVAEKRNEEEIIVKNDDVKVQTKKSLKVKVPKEKNPKIKQQLMKLKKEKIMKTVKDPRKVRITKRMKKYSLIPRTSSSAVRKLQSLCVDFLNTSQYRNFARNQSSIINKNSKMRVLKDFKKKFNLDTNVKKPPMINQKFNHSRMNSLREICGKYLVNKNHSKLLEIDDDDDDDDESEEYGHDDVIENESCDDVEVATLKNLCKQRLIEMNIDVVENDENYLFTPLTLKEICESFIYTNHQYFHIEEVNNVPRLQELCNAALLSDENIFVNFDESEDISNSMNVDVDTANTSTDSNEPIYIVEESSGNVGEIFESENLNSYEKTEILRRIQRVANIDDDDEIMRAIGALHVDPITDNNNECDVSNKNIQRRIECCYPEANELSMLNANSTAASSNGSELKFDSEMSFVSYLNDDLLHTVQYEEIFNDNGQKTSNKNFIEILRHKLLNRTQKQHNKMKKILSRILKRSKNFHLKKSNINSVLMKVRQNRQQNLLLKTAELNCDKISKNHHQNYHQLNDKSHNDTTMKIMENAKEFEKAQQKHQHDDEFSGGDSMTTKNLTENCDVVDKCRRIEAESNLPKLPSVLPSINEYRIEGKSNQRNHIKDSKSSSSIVKPRKPNFEESLLNIDHKMLKNGSALAEKSTRRSSTSSNSSSHRRYNNNSNHRHTSSSNSSRSSSRRTSNGHRRHRSRSRSKSKSRSKSHHHHRHHHKSTSSSREISSHKKDQTKHSEAKRLVIPSYKLYDKNLDIKLKTMPYVKMEREDKVDEMMKKFM